MNTPDSGGAAGGLPEALESALDAQERACVSHDEYATLPLGWHRGDPLPAKHLFTEIRDAIKLAISARADEARRAALEECRKIAENYADVVDGSYGKPSPNLAMTIEAEITALCDIAVHGASNGR